MMEVRMRLSHCVRVCVGVRVCVCVRAHACVQVREGCVGVHVESARFTEFCHSYGLHAYIHTHAYAHAPHKLDR